MLRPAISLLAVLVVGCADQPADDSATGGGGGGKSDDATTTRSGALVLLTETEQDALRASDAECLHVNYTRNETYDQAVKLFCLPYGGDIVPIAMFVAVTPLGEADGAYKVFKLPDEYFSDAPESVTFRMSGTKATYSFKGHLPNFETETLTYTDKLVTASVTFSGASEDPAIAGAFTVTE
jgi:hypothetical protein